ncbi:MAG TPA: ATP-binding protein [Vicinamibacterales bacterium]|nr:ATP-binding protein [Vicinamibacterales bacterium]
MLTYDRRVVLLAVAAGLPGLILSLALLWIGQYSWLLQTTLALLVVGLWGSIVVMLRNRIVRPLQTVSNLLAALREDDFSIRGRGAAGDDPLGQVMQEVNSLAETLRAQRLGAQEATALLRAVIAEIDVAIFAFDGQRRVALVNQYGARLMGVAQDELVGRKAEDLGFDSALRTDSGIQDVSFPGRSARWEIRRRQFWQGGQRHELLVLADVSQPLREQERQAWQRLIRVIGHELNNSLAPIKSIAGSLGALIARASLPDDWRDDMQRGLAIIASRADALGRFTVAYAQLARLPAPRIGPTPIAPLMRRVVSLETRLPVTLEEGPEFDVPGDADQLEQLLINVVRNAVDAALETGGRVAAGWNRQDGHVEVWIEDEGPGLQSTGNLFVPFFTTKPGGSGIGLVLSRQIAEGHGGSLTLENRSGHRGTRATLTLPM